MADPRRTPTNAADSAPGVDDGRARRDGPPVNSKPGARRPVWILVLVSIVVLLAIFIARPRPDRDGATIGPAQTAGEIERSTVPGAADPTTQAS